MDLVTVVINLSFTDGQPGEQGYVANVACFIVYDSGNKGNQVAREDPATKDLVSHVPQTTV